MANVFNILPEHDKARIHLHGNMSVSFNTAVTDSFLVRFFTTTNELFSFDTDAFKFKDLEDTVVNGLIVGGLAGLFIELMFDPVQGTWYITANNLVGLDGSGTTSGPGTDETPLTIATLPALTEVDYAVSKNRRALLTKDIKLKNPSNMKPGDSLKIVLEQDLVGNRKVTYDGAYGFKEAQIPVVSTGPQVVDVLNCYMTADYTMQCDLLLNYSVVRPLCYGTDFYYNMASAYSAEQVNPTTGQNVQVIRDGWRSECNGTIGFNTNGFDLRVKGVPKSNGQLPELKLDHTDRPSFGKAMINIEGGRNVVIEDLKISGTSTGTAGDGNGTGVLINNAVDYALLKNLHIFDNEDGVRSGVARHPQYDLVNVFLDSNGRVDNSAHAGQSHSIYAGDVSIWRGIQSTWWNSIQGHNIKTRGIITHLKQVYSRKSNQGREIDCCDQGILRVEDSVFWKEASAANNNLISIGAECSDGVNRVQEYFIINSYLHNDIGSGRDSTFLENLTKTVENTVPVHFIDCLFGGAILTKENLAGIFKGPYTITLTGGPVGPRVAAGSTHMQFDPSMIPAGAVTNPLNIALTPFGDLPAMSVIPASPPYPTFVPVPAVPPLPSFSTKPPEADTTPPTASLVASSVSVIQDGGVTLTATATDNVSVAKVEFYKNDALLLTDTSVPYTVVETFTYANNGTHRYKVIAYDFTNNKTTSNEVTITVNIEPPHTKPTTQFDASLQTAYDSAVNSAAVGGKRLAAANAIVTAFGSDQKLYLYRDGTKIAMFAYSALEVVDDGYDVYVKPSATVVDYSVYSAASLSTGDWWYELSYAQTTPNHTITGTVGGVGSGADVVLEQDPAPDVSYNIEFKFVLPRSLDNLV